MAMKTHTMYRQIPTEKGYKMVNESVVRKQMEEFEKGFPDGVYSIPREKHEPRLNVRKMYAYCDHHSIDPKDLTKEQMEQFYIYD